MRQPSLSSALNPACFLAQEDTNTPLGAQRQRTSNLSFPSLLSRSPSGAPQTGSCTSFSMSSLHPANLGARSKAPKNCCLATINRCQRLLFKATSGSYSDQPFRYRPSTLTISSIANMVGNSYGILESLISWSIDPWLSATT